MSLIILRGFIYLILNKIGTLNIIRYLLPQKNKLQQIIFILLFKYTQYMEKVIQKFII